MTQAELRARQWTQTPNEAVEPGKAVLRECDKPAVRSRILEWHTDAAGCTGSSTVAVLKKRDWHMAVMVGQNSRERYTWRMLHYAAGGAAAGCYGSN